MAKKQEGDSWPEHPLFPAEEGEEPARVEFIQVVRYEGGRALLVPTTFRAGELTSLDSINSMYGGGLYELIGRRCSIHDPTSMGRISGKVRYELAGKSRPLVEGGTVLEPQTPTTPVTAAPIYQPGGQGNGGMSDQVLIAIMNSQAASQQQFAALMMQMMQQGRADQSAMMTTLMQMSGQQQQSMVGMMSAMMSKTGGGTDEIAKMAELFKTLGVIGPKGDEGGAESESIGSIISNVADIVSGAVELKGGLPGATVPPGSAASALGMPPMPKKPEIG